MAPPMLVRFVKKGQADNTLCEMVQRGAGSSELAAAGPAIPVTPAWRPHCSPDLPHQQQSGEAHPSGLLMERLL